MATRHRLGSETVFFQLSNAVSPVLYELFWTLTEESLCGNSRIHAQVVSEGPVQEIELHSLDIDVKDFRVFRKKSEGSLEEIPVKERTIIPSYEIVRFTLDPSFPSLPKSGDQLLLEVRYITQFGAGIGIFRYSSDPNCVVTHMEPTHARRVYPCFDEPTFKARYQVQLTHRAGYTSLSNTPKASEMAIEGTDMVTARFEETPPMSPYLVCIVTGKLAACECETKRGVSCRVWVNQKYSVNGGLFVLDLLDKAVTFYEDYFTYEYPLRKIDIVGIPNFPVLGMENFGLLCFEEEFLVVQEHTPYERRRRIARLVGHEVCHQWFGNVVSLKRWNYIWLKEGFCRFMEFVFVHHHYPTWQIWCDFVSMVQNVALVADSPGRRNRAPHPIEISGDLHPREVFDYFDIISYGKAAAVIRMLNGQVGDRSFQRALQAFIKRHEFSAASTSDLLRCVDEAAGSEETESAPEDSPVTPISSEISHWVTSVRHPYILVHMSPEETPVLKQFVMPNLRVGFLDVLPKGQFQTPTGHRSPPSLPTISGSEIPSVTVSITDVTYPSQWVIPMRATEIERGQTSVARNFILREEELHYKSQVVAWFHTNCVGAFRCDYDVASWEKVLEVYSFFGALDRLAICTTIFELRTLHVGRLFPDEPYDRCVIPLMLLNTIAEKPEKHDSIWAYVSEQLLLLQHLLLRGPVSVVFKRTIHRVLGHLCDKDQLATFTSAPSNYDLQPTTQLSQRTINRVLRIAAVADHPDVVEDAQNYASWVLSGWFQDIVAPTGFPPCQIEELDMERVTIALRIYGRCGTNENWWVLVDLFLAVYPEGLLPAPLSELMTKLVRPPPLKLDPKIQLDTIDCQKWQAAVLPGLIVRVDSDVANLQVALCGHMGFLDEEACMALVYNSAVLSQFLLMLEEPAGQSNIKMWQILQIVSKYCANGIVGQQLALLHQESSYGVQLNTTWADYVAEHYVHFLKSDAVSHVRIPSEIEVGT